MKHNNHGSILRHGFNDSCEQCTRIVNNPTLMDEDNMIRLWGGNVFTNADRVALDNIYHSVIVAQILGRAVAELLGYKESGQTPPTQYDLTRYRVYT